MISSSHNPKIQLVRKLQAQSTARREGGAFVAEGVRLVEEALKIGWKADLLLYTPDLSARGLAVVEGFRAQGTSVEEVTPEVMKAASQTDSPQGLLAVLELHPLPLPSKPDFVLIPDGVRDPGNLGTILRTAAAAGVQAVLLPPGSTDAYAPKVVRSAMGAHFQLSVTAMGWEQIATYLRSPDWSLKIYLADAGGGTPYSQADFRLPLALIVGGEAEGAGEEAARMADSRVNIPMPGEVESLNAAVAGAILMFEVVRQRVL